MEILENITFAIKCVMCRTFGSEISILELVNNSKSIKLEGLKIHYSKQGTLNLDYLPG